MNDLPDDQLQDCLSDRSAHASGAIEFIAENFPALAGRLALPLHPFSRGFGLGDGASSHPGLVRSDWLSYFGGRSFARDASVPDGFIAMGVRNAGGSEYLFALWREGQRRFWFQDQYVNFQVGNAYTQTRERLDAALARWNSGAPLVAVCGGTDLTESRFPKSSGSS